MEKEAEKDNEIERGWGCDMKKETEKEAERWTPHCSLILLQVVEIEARAAYTAAKLRTWNWHYEHIILKASSSC